MSKYWENKVKETSMYYVNLWGSHPDEDNDDCWCGKDFSSREEALEVFAKPSDHFSASSKASTEYIQIIGPDIDKVQPISFGEGIASSLEEDAWAKEIAREEGMLHGVEAYNEVRGY